MLAHSFLIESSSKLLVTRTGIKAWLSLILGWITHFGVTCPWVTKISHFRTWRSLRVGGRLHYVGRLDQNSGVHGNRKPPLTYNRENGVSTFSLLLLVRSFLYLQVTRTCIKSRMCMNYGQIGPLTTELAALEHHKISHRLLVSIIVRFAIRHFCWNKLKYKDHKMP